MGTATLSLTHQTIRKQQQQQIWVTSWHCSFLACSLSWLSPVLDPHQAMDTMITIMGITMDITMDTTMIITMDITMIIITSIIMIIIITMITTMIITMATTMDIITMITMIITMVGTKDSSISFIYSAVSCSNLIVYPCTDNIINHFIAKKKTK